MYWIVMRLLIVLSLVWAACDVFASVVEVYVGQNVIVSSGGADLAAQQLRKHLSDVFGSMPPIVKKQEITDDVFVWHVGECPAEKDWPTSGETAFWRVTPEGAWFWGNGGGTSHAVSIFAEECLGCRWPFGTASYAVRRTTIKLETGDGRWTPPLMIHRIRSNWCRDRSHVAWNARMCYGVGGSMAFGHAFSDYWKRYSKTHPDFFAMRPDGHRLPMDVAPRDGIAAGNGVKNAARISLCVSNPELLETVVSNWVLAGAGPCVNLCENDAWPIYHCHCERCYALDGEDYKGARSDFHHAGRYVAFANKVLAAARKIRPDARVCTYAYNASTYAPRNVKVDKGVVLGIVPFVFTKAAIEEYLSEWKRAGMKDFVYRPNRHFYYRVRNLPLGCDEHFFDICKMMIDAGAVGLDYDSPNVTGLFEWEVDYVVAHAMRDPSKPFDYWMRRYAEAFGSASGEVYDYYAYWRENLWKKRLEPQQEKLTFASHVYDFAKGVVMDATAYYREEDFLEAGEFLRRALRRTDLDPRARSHVNKLAIANRNAHLTFRAIRDKGASKSALDELVKFRQKHGFKLCPWEEIGRGDVCGMLSRPEAAAKPAENQYAPMPDPIWARWD